MGSYESSVTPMGACVFPGEFSSTDAEAGEDVPLSEAEMGSKLEWGEEFSLSPQNALPEDVSVPGSELGPPGRGGGADGPPGQPVTAPRLLGRGLLASGESAAAALPAPPSPPVPAPRRRKSWGVVPPPRCSPSTGGGCGVVDSGCASVGGWCRGDSMWHCYRITPRSGGCGNDSIQRWGGWRRLCRRQPQQAQCRLPCLRR